MDFLHLSESRFSVRKFNTTPIEDDKIERILRAGQVAPTACNNQPQKIFVLKSPDSLNKWHLCSEFHFGETLVILTCFDRNTCWYRKFDSQSSGFVDASIVTTHMMLEATELGIGSTWIMLFDPEKVRQEFSLPDNYIPVSVLAMGYPSVASHPSHLHGKIKELSETVTFL